MNVAEAFLSTSPTDVKLHLSLFVKERGTDTSFSEELGPYVGALLVAAIFP